MSEQVLQTLQGVVSEAVEERRGLVVYSRLQPVEMDRLARQLERDTLEKIQHLLPEKAADERVLGVQRRLERMQGVVEADA